VVEENGHAERIHDAALNTLIEQLVVKGAVFKAALLYHRGVQETREYNIDDDTWVTRLKIKGDAGVILKSPGLNLLMEMPNRGFHWETSESYRFKGVSKFKVAQTKHISAGPEIVREYLMGQEGSMYGPEQTHDCADFAKGLFNRLEEDVRVVLGTNEWKIVNDAVKQQADARLMLGKAISVGGQKIPQGAQLLQDEALAGKECEGLVDLAAGSVLIFRLGANVVKKKAKAPQGMTNQEVAGAVSRHTGFSKAK